MRAIAVLAGIFLGSILTLLKSYDIRFAPENIFLSITAD